MFKNRSYSHFARDFSFTVLDDKSNGPRGISVTLKFTVMNVLEVEEKTQV